MVKLTARSAFWIFAVLAIGAFLRWYCIRNFPQLQGDALLYSEFTRNWMTRGIYGFTDHAGVRPTLIRLPGYPLFLAACFRFFGQGNLQAVLHAQLVIDLANCGLIGLLAKRLGGSRPQAIAFVLAALCPFFAAYTAAGLTETLTIFCTTLAFLALQFWLDVPSVWNRWLIVLGVTLAYAILLRPDQGLLAAAIIPAVLVGKKARHLKQQVLPMVALSLIAILPLVPWTIRNYRTFHVFQPLAPRYANDPGDANPYGFQRWYRTWAIDYASTEDIYWKYDGEPIELQTLPSRAFDSASQYRQTAAAFAFYNQTARDSAKADARFAMIAADRVRAHPVAYYFGLPVARVANMLFRPRVEWIPGPLCWWRIRESTPSAFSISVFFGVANALFISLGIAGAIKLRRHRELRPLLGAMGAYIVLRCVLLLTLDNSEPRYTIEFMPIWIVLLSAYFSRDALSRSSKSS